MLDKTVVVTGGNAGLGFQCAKNIALSSSSYHVILACRSESRGAAAADTLRSQTNNPNISAMALDLADLGSVRAFAEQFARTPTPPLEGIVCNAGISAAGIPEVTCTVDGFEPIFAVNHLGHFLLVNLMIDQMSSGRIVFVTSDLHDPPAFFPAKVTYENAAKIASGRSGMSQYCVSKLCNLYCTYEMDHLLRETSQRITVNAFNPGAMTDTGFSRPTGNILVRATVRAIGGIMGGLIGKQSTATESGAALAALITSPSFDGISGRYFDRNDEAKSSVLSHNRANARELWAASVAMSGLTTAATTFSKH